MSKRTDLLKSLSRALSPNKVDFSVFDLELEKLKKSLEETVNIQTVDDVSRKLKQFQSKLDFTPLITEIDGIRNQFNDQVKQLETNIKDKNQELISASEDRNVIRADLLNKEIDGLEVLLTGLQTSRLADLNSLSNQILDLNTSGKRTTQSLKEISDALSSFSSKKDTEKALKDIQDALESNRLDFLNKLKNIGGGSMNRQMFVGGTDPLTKYTDVNWKAGTNVTLTVANNNTTKRAEITITASGSGGGTVRSINSISANTNAGATSGTDYVYLCTGTITLTLPDATANTNLYTVKNVGSGTVTINTTSSQTIDGASTIVMPVQYTAVDLISDTANWNVT